MRREERGGKKRIEKFTKFMYISSSMIVSEVSFLVRSMAQIFYIYLFQAVRRAVNVLNVYTCI